MKRSGRIPRTKTVRKVSKRGVTHAKLHDLLRDVILARDGQRCRKCGAGHEKILQAAHIYGKGAHPSMRYMLANVLCLCKPCHFGWWHRRGFGREAAPNNEVRDWCIAQLGAQHMRMLDICAGYKGPKKPFDSKATWIMLDQELGKLRRIA